jgi:hypothetical protein
VKKKRLIFSVDIYSIKDVDFDNTSLLNYFKRSVVMQSTAFNGSDFEPTFLIDNEQIHTIVMGDEKHKEVS